jgi:hypothetical protein
MNFGHRSPRATIPPAQVIMRIFTPCNTLLSPRDARLISSIVRGHLGLTSNPQVLVTAWSRCRSPVAPWSRGAKTKTTKKLKELHQGVIAAEPLPDLETDNAPQYPTVVQGAKNNMIKFSNCVLITRVGSFYEVRSTYAPSMVLLLSLYSCISITPKSMLLSLT